VLQQTTAAAASKFSATGNPVAHVCPAGLAAFLSTALFCSCAATHAAASPYDDVRGTTSRFPFC
jgi:hypothetical protein